MILHNGDIIKEISVSYKRSQCVSVLISNPFTNKALCELQEKINLIKQQHFILKCNFIVKTHNSQKDTPTHSQTAQQLPLNSVLQTYCFVVSACPVPTYFICTEEEESNKFWSELVQLLDFNKTTSRNTEVKDPHNNTTMAKKAFKLTVLLLSIDVVSGVGLENKENDNFGKKRK